MNIQNIVLIGSGNLATNLAFAFKNAGLNIQYIYSRRESHARKLAEKIGAPHTDSLTRLPRNADLYLISISDAAILKTASELPGCKGICAHTSGSINMSVLGDIFKNYGVFYPLMNFSASAISEFKKTPLCIEGNSEKTFAALNQLANLISDHVREMNSVDRQIVHLAAVFACNFTNMNYVIAEKILEKNNIPFDLLRPLILETARKVQKSSPAQLQTGPAMRNDKTVIETQLKMLEAIPEFKELYEMFTKHIQNTQKTS